MLFDFRLSYYGLSFNRGGVRRLHSICRADGRGEVYYSVRRSEIEFCRVKQLVQQFTVRSFAGMADFRDYRDPVT